MAVRLAILATAWLLVLIVGKTANVNDVTVQHKDGRQAVRFVTQSMMSDTLLF